MKRSTNMHIIGGKNFGGINCIGGTRKLNGIGLGIVKPNYGIVGSHYGIGLGIAGTTVQSQLDSLVNLKQVIGQMAALNGISTTIAGTSEKISCLTGINSVINTVNSMLNGVYSGVEFQNQMSKLALFDSLIGQVNSKLNYTGIFKDTDSQLAYLGTINDVIGQTTSKLGSIGIGTLGVGVNPEFSGSVLTGFNVKLTPIGNIMGITGIETKI